MIYLSGWPFFRNLAHDFNIPGFLHVPEQMINSSRIRSTTCQQGCLCCQFGNLVTVNVFNSQNRQHNGMNQFRQRGAITWAFQRFIQLVLAIRYSLILRVKTTSNMDACQAWAIYDYCTMLVPEVIFILRWVLRSCLVRAHVPAQILVYAHLQTCARQGSANPR